MQKFDAKLEAFREQHKATNKISVLLNFAKLFKSYNPDLPMAPGMKAEFQKRLSAIADLL